jgi:cyclopropane fatty-acyl-phospholipid synthase-like methyltransferase
MSTVLQHYASHLGPIYLWMAGGYERAIEIGRSDLKALGVDVCAGMNVLDLGAGFGMHAIPLAQAGCSVTAVDSSALLLQELTQRSHGLSIRVAEGDLLDCRHYVDAPQSLVLCMGDTLTHIQSHDEVTTLFDEVSKTLEKDGVFALTYRNYMTPASGAGRFIPVRSDDTRIHTCFLEEGPTHMDVHDIVHERNGDAWRMQVSSYKKLRLDPEWVLDALRKAGLTPKASPGPRGMIQVVARVG